MGKMEELKEDVKPKKTLKDLGKAADDLSPFLKWKPVVTAEGDEIKGKYIPIEGKLVDWSKRTTTFKKDGADQVREVFDLKFIINGRERTLSAGQTLAKEVSKKVTDFGAVVRITRKGEGFDTEYSIEVIG
jgi:hypothetical protein